KKKCIFFFFKKKEVFRRLNKLLNEWTTKTSETNGRTNPVIYQRKYEIDKIYDNGVRVTLDARDANRVVTCIQKEKVSELNLICPHMKYDIRFSAKMEKGLYVPKNQIVKKVRTKDRISYHVDNMFNFSYYIVFLMMLKKQLKNKKNICFIFFAVLLGPYFCGEIKSNTQKSKRSYWCLLFVWFCAHTTFFCGLCLQKAGSEKFPKTTDCEVTFEVEIEIFQKEDLFNRRQALQKAMQAQSPSPDGFNLIIYHLLQHVQHLNGLGSNLQFTPPLLIVK
ncbi:hypothetical protein RFI_25839, partial [Reticulomyxa filosa]